MGNRSMVMVLVASIAAGCSSAPWTPEYTCADCNVLVVSIDTLRADHLGCYGYPKPTSPAVDRFSQDAILFRSAIAQAPSTTPSHASIFTSLVPEHHGAFRAKNLPISEDVLTMAEILAESGWRTVSYNGGGQVSARFGFNRGFEIYESSRSSEGSFASKVDPFLQWTRENPDSRWFAFLHTYEIHAPYTPLESHLRTMDQGYSGPLPDKISTTLLIRINKGEVLVDDDDIRHIVDAYDAELRSVDEAFGRLIDQLKAQGLYDRTIIVFTSDHGEEFGEHGKVGSHSHALFDELLKVPLLIKLPGSAFASTVVDEQVRSVDILPTVLEILDLEQPAQCEGRSLVGLVEGGGEELAAVSQQDTTDRRPPASIRTESRKLIVGPDGGSRYFVLTDDPGEQNDLADAAEHRDTALELKRRLDAFLATRDAAALTNPAIELDTETLEQLEALGYVD